MTDATGSPQSLLVLGGGSDIGQAIVRRLVGRRARRVVLAGRKPEDIKPFADELGTLGAESVERVAFDALDTPSHDVVLADAFSGPDDVDCVLVAFGVLGDQEAAERDPDTATEVIRTNYEAAVSVLLRAARHLRRQGHGTIVVLSSVAAERARRANFVYGSSKAGLDAFCCGLADSLVGTGVRVMVVRPGFVHTKMTAGMRAAPLSTTPEKVADAVVAGLERGAGTVWAPPALRFVFAGLRHLPRPLWRKMPA